MTFDLDKELRVAYVKFFPHAMKLTRDKDRANDVLHDTVLRALEKSYMFTDDGKSGSFQRWFYTILHNEFVNAMRRNRRHLHADIEAASNVGVDAVGIRGMLDGIGGRLKTLNQDQRGAILMQSMAEMTLCEIAELQGTSVGTIKSRLSRGRAKLEQ